jgi:hypothetical protein
VRNLTPTFKPCPHRPRPPDVIKEKLEVIFAVLQANPARPQVSHMGNVHDRFLQQTPDLRFISTPRFDGLEELGLRYSGELVERGDHSTRAAESAALGEQYMSSRDMYLQLNFVQDRVAVRRKLLYLCPRLGVFPE